MIKFSIRQERLSPEDRERIFWNSLDRFWLFSSLDIEAQAGWCDWTRMRVKVEYHGGSNISKQKWYRKSSLTWKFWTSPKMPKRLALRDSLSVGRKRKRPGNLLAEFSRPVVNYFIDQGALLVFEKEHLCSLLFKDKESTEALVLNAEQEVV